MAALGCARTPPAPVVAVDGPTSALAPAPPASASVAPPPPAPAPPRLRFQIADQVFRQDEKARKEVYWVKLDVFLDAQRLASLTLKEPGCRAAFSPEELEAKRGKVLGGLVCYY